MDNVAQVRRKGKGIEVSFSGARHDTLWRGIGLLDGLMRKLRVKEKIGELYWQPSRDEATKLLENIIFNLKSAYDGELIRWENTLKHWREPILNHFDNHTTNGFTEGCNTKIKMLK